MSTGWEPPQDRSEPRDATSGGQGPSAEPTDRHDAARSPFSAGGTQDAGGSPSWNPADGVPGYPSTQQYGQPSGSQYEHTQYEPTQYRGASYGQYGGAQYDQYGAGQYGAPSYGGQYGGAYDAQYGANPYGTPYPPYGSGAYPGGYGYPAYTPPPATSGAAVAALVCGVIGLFTAGITSIPAVICGHVAWPDTRSGRAGGHGLTIAGLVLGYLPIAGWILFWIFFSVAIAGAHR